MTAFTYRMGAGFAGDVNRSHPASIEPNINDATNPIIFPGQAGVYNTTAGTFRQIIASDSALTAINGVSVRQFPTQATGPSVSTENWGQADYSTGYTNSISPANCLDVLKSGYIMVPVNGTTAKGGTVYIYYGTTSAPHYQGGFEAASGSNILGLTTQGQTYYNSAPDANGVCELAFNC